MRLMLGGVLATLLTASRIVPAAPQPAPPYRLIDLSGDFVRFFDATQGQSDADRVAAFYRDVSPRFPEFYDAGRFDEGRQDQRILRSIRQFPDIRVRYLTASTQFASAIAPAYASFSRAFPDMPPIGDVYLLHSLGEMDGGTRELRGRVDFIFGADVMARVHAGFASEQPFFHHELFHRYHERFFSACDPVWCGLWEEGLAVYVAAQLNAGASDDELLLSSPEPIRATVDADRTLAVCIVKSRLDSTEPDDVSQLFEGQAHPDRLPPRFGYYVGYLAMQEAARDHSLQELAHMDRAQARPVIDAALTALAPVCPAAN